MLLSRLKFWLTIGLLVSNLVVGGLSLYFLHSVGERYSNLLDRSVPALNALRTHTRELSAIQRLARRAVDPENEPLWAELLPQMKDASSVARGRARMLADMESFNGTTHASAIQAASRGYDDHVDEFLDLAAARRLTDANRYNNEVLRPAYDAYQAVLDEAGDHVEQQGKDLRERYIEESRFFSGLLLALASWPVLVAMLAGVVMVLMVGALIIAIFAPGLTWRRPPPPAA